MPNDVTTDINIIRNSSRGEDVRDAIIRLFQEVNAASIGVTLTEAEYNALTEAERNNGTMYFVSDMSIENGEDMYYGEQEGTSTHVIITKQTALAIANMARRISGINANVKLPDVPSLVGHSNCLIFRYGRVLTGSYNSGGTWYYYPNATKKYVIDVYKVPVGRRYMAGLGGVIGNVCYISVFKTDPLLASENITNGTSVTSSTSPTAFMNSRINITYNDVEYAYIVIRVSSNSNLNAESFVIDTTILEENIELLLENNDDEYENDEDED